MHPSRKLLYAATGIEALAFTGGPMLAVTIPDAGALLPVASWTYVEPPGAGDADTPLIVPTGTLGRLKDVEDEPQTIDGAEAGDGEIATCNTATPAPSGNEL
jgi:hypothetical protein